MGLETSGSANGIILNDRTFLCGDKYCYAGRVTVIGVLITFFTSWLAFPRMVP